MVSRDVTQNLYAPTVQIENQKSLYEADGIFSWFVGPPFEAVILTPLGTLAYLPSAILWTIGSIVALVTSFYLIKDAVKISNLQWRRYIVIALASAPALSLLLAGQNTAYLLLSLALAQYAIRQKHAFVAGVALALALVKPHLVLLLPCLWLLERRWNALLGFATGVGCWIAVSLLVFEPGILAQWLGALQSDVFATEVHEGQTRKGGGLVGLTTPWLPHDNGTLWITIASVGIAILGLVALLLIHRRTDDEILRWWLVVFTGVLIAPHAMIYDLVLVLPAVGLALHKWWTPAMRVSSAVSWTVLWVFVMAGPFLAQLETQHPLARTPWPVVTLVVLLVVTTGNLNKPPVCQHPKPRGT